MISRSEVVAMHRMVLADAPTNPELAQTFFDAGPKQTREIVRAFFARPAIRAQLRDEIDLAILPVFLINCIIGDPYERMMFPAIPPSQDELESALDQRLDLFYRAVLKVAD
jgi:TetR/AcrR family transcriptional repressor of mexJK operon